MSEKSSREIDVIRYFSRTPDKPVYFFYIVLIIIGAISLLISFFTNFNLFFLCVGIFFAFLGIMTLFNKKSSYDAACREPKPSDEQMDELFFSDKQRIISDAMEMLKLESEDLMHELIMLNPGNSAKFKKGKDGNLRFSAYRIVIIYLTNYHLISYSCDLNFINGNTNNEETQEYHYIDVVSMATLTVKSNFKWIDIYGKEYPIKSYQQFSLSVSSGQKIEVTIANKVRIEDGKLPSSGADTAINTIRKMLRDKKGGSDSHFN